MLPTPSLAPVESTPRSAGRFAAASLAAWLIFLAMDFWMHAVILAFHWKTAEQYFRPPEELFKLIPFGYAAFAIFCGAMVWLLWTLQGGNTNAVHGAKFGAVAGLLYWGSWSLGAYSVFRFPLEAVFYWTLGGVVEAAAAAMAAAWVLPAAQPWKRAAAVFGFTLLLLVVGVLTQNLLVPREAFTR